MRLPLLRTCPWGQSNSLVRLLDSHHYRPNPGSGPKPGSFFLASAPVDCLDKAKTLVEARGGDYAAGDKDDIFNSMTLQDQDSWKLGWKGKVEATINLQKKYNPNQMITALAIAGGPACDWERAELRNVFQQNHSWLTVKQLGDYEDLEMWLDKYHPA